MFRGEKETERKGAREASTCSTVFPLMKLLLVGGDWGSEPGSLSIIKYSLCQVHHHPAPKISFLSKPITEVSFLLFKPRNIFSSI